jgi:hypothetical protein
MPYIIPARKSVLDTSSSPGSICQGAGELTYVLQQAVSDYITAHGVSYKTFVEVLGSLEGLKIDVSHRLINPYEDNKRTENGDVWPTLTRAKSNGTV